MGFPKKSVSIGGGGANANNTDGITFIKCGKIFKQIYTHKINLNTNKNKEKDGINYGKDCKMCILW